MAKKTAYVSLTFLFQYEPEELELSEDCSEDEFEAAARTAALSEMGHRAEWVNDVEVSFN